MSEPTLEEAKAGLFKCMNATSGKPEFVIIDNRFHQWLFKAHELLVKQGYLAPGYLVEVEEQYSYMRYDILQKAFDEARAGE